MIFHISKKIQNEFDRNLKDWYLGGPKDNGWTRTGPAIKEKQAKLINYSFINISIDEVLAKNYIETEKWHMDFLRNMQNIVDTRYYSEYLCPRYKGLSINRANYFINLVKDIELNGVRKPVWVADVEDLKMGFKYFRFNGCHRACALKFIGKKEIFAIVFKTCFNDTNNAN